MATQSDIAFHYDVDNDFYALFLDRACRAYSCAVWEGARTLEEAQHQKLARLARFANLKPGQSVLDVGCGWGGMMDFAITHAGVREARGLTLSSDQHRYITERQHPHIQCHLQSWRDHRIEIKVDAIVSIGAFEHFASLEDRAANRHREVYADFFEWCRANSKDDACVGLQTIVTSRPPQTLQEVRDTRYLLQKVFPGSALPSVSDVQAAIQDQYEITECRRIGLDYARTLEHWRLRLNDSRILVEQRYGKDLFAHYNHYFEAAERGFRSGVIDLLQLGLRPTSPAAVTFKS